MNYQKMFLSLITSLLFVLSCSKIYAFDEGDFLVRIRGIAVLPNDSSGSLSTVKNSGVRVGDSGTGELDFTYMWTENIGTELILATTKHSLKGKKALSGVRIGSTWVLPPTLTLQYHFFSCSCFQPYVGVGVNYTVFYHEHCSLPTTHLKLRNSWGVAAQVGFDYLLTDCWFLNFDLKYITMDTKAHLKGTTAGTVDVTIDPFVVGAGIGYRF